MARRHPADPARHAVRPRGVALLIVITILVTMVIVAVPFALSMRQGQERTQAVGARSRAVFEARLVSEIVKLFLVGTHPDQEQKRFQRGDRTVDAQPSVDSLDEITPNDTFRKKVEEEILSDWEKDPRMMEKARYLKSRGLGPLNDDRGSIWSVQVQDAQALVNVNGASPFLLANLLGSALLADDLDTGSGDISVDNVVTGRFGGLSGFPRGGGYIRIGREVIRYESFDGTVFRNCERGMLLDTPLRDNGSPETHAKGEPVIDYTAWKLATHAIARRPGSLTRFENLEALRDIASWGEHGVLAAARLERVLPYLTVWSRRETSSGTLAEQLVMNELPEAVDGSGGEQVRLRDRENPSGTTAYFNPGTIVRITDGVYTAYQGVSGVGDDDGRQREDFVTLAGRVNAVDPTVAFKGGSTRIAALAPYPININTAAREVLYAVMANVQDRAAKEKEQIVTPELAWKLAGEIVDGRKGEIRTDAASGRRVGGPFRHAEDFGRFLEAKVRSSEITRAQFAALYLNAINPHSYRLRFGTAPWCYRTLDVYHLESRVVLNNRAGEQIAEAGLREVVEIGSDATAAWTLDSQDDFEQRLGMGSGAKWVTTYPFGVAWKSRNTHHIQPAERGPKGFVSNVYPSAARGEDLGDVRLEPARLLLDGPQVVDHFDRSWYSEGHFTGFDGAYKRRTRNTFFRRGDPLPRPFSMSFWWRPYSTEDWTVFDTGVEQFRDRVALFVQQTERGRELTFRCCAGTLQRQGAEVYVPLDQLDYEPGTWYHLQVSCVGEDPATMQLLVDGVDIGRRRGVTFLSASLAGDGTEVGVESTDGFPVRGALRIGREIIEYDTLADGSFRDCIRGARGTQRPPGEDGEPPSTPGYEFPAGTPVHVLGYSFPITVDVMPGGATLTEPLRPWTAVRVSTIGGGGSGVEDLPPVAGTPPLQFRGFPPGTQNIQVTTRAMWGQDDTTSAEAFGSKGIALLGSPQPKGWSYQTTSSTGQTTTVAYDIPEDFGGWEFCSYERTGNEFTITRYHESKWTESPHGEYWLMTELVLPDGPVEYGTMLVPVSVYASGGGGGDDYLDPGDATQLEILQRYYPREPESESDVSYSRRTTARVLLSRDSDDKNKQQHEVIRYDTLDRSKGSPGLLFVSDRNVAELVSYFFGGAVQQPPTGPTTPAPTPVPVPPDPTPDPVPVPPGGGFDPPPGDGTPQDPTPGGGVPPGLRDPADPAEPTPEPEPPDVPTDPGTGPPTTEEPGFGDPPTLPGTETPGSSGEPTGPGEDEPGTDAPEAATDGTTETPETQEGTTDESDGDGSGGGTAEPLPPPEEPSEDTSGGGGDYGGDPTAEGVDALIPNVKPGLLREHEWDTLPEKDVDTTIGVPTALDTVDLFARFAWYAGRSQNGTYVLDHEGQASAGGGGARFLPCFRVWETSAGGTIQRIGRNDLVTITDGAEGESTRAEVGVRWGLDGASRWNDWVALDDFVEHRFQAPKEGADQWRTDPRGRARVLKFPCGEMPEKLGPEIEWGQSAISGSSLVTAFLDELHIWRNEVDPPLTVVDSEGVSPQGQEIVVYIGGPPTTPDTLDGYDADCGVLQLEGELIVYRGSRVETVNTIILERCARGQFGTRPTFHPWGSKGRFLPEVPVSYLDAGMTAEASTIPSARTHGWPREGLVRIVSEDTAELVHFTRRGERELIMPVSLDADERTRDRGLFRGRFGTDATDHDGGEIVIFQPFRYWDRFTPRRTDEKESFSGVHAHPDASYLELGTKVRSAYWRGFNWSENLLGRLSSGGVEESRGSGDASSHLDIYVLARFSPNVPWDTTKIVDMRQEAAFGTSRDLATKALDHLFLFDRPGDKPIGEGGLGNRLGLESDTAEFRVYFVYQPNAFFPVDGARRSSGEEAPILSNPWKLTPWLRSFGATYFSRTMVRYRAPLGR